MDLTKQADKLAEQKNKLKEQAKKLEQKEKELREKRKSQMLEQLAEKTLGKKWQENLNLILQNNASLELFVNGEKYQSEN